MHHGLYTFLFLESLATCTHTCAIRLQRIQLGFKDGLETCLTVSSTTMGVLSTSPPGGDRGSRLRVFVRACSKQWNKNENFQANEKTQSNMKNTIIFQACICKYCTCKGSWDYYRQCFGSGEGPEEDSDPDSESGYDLGKPCHFMSQRLSEGHLLMELRQWTSLKSQNL